MLRFLMRMFDRLGRRPPAATTATESGIPVRDDSPPLVDAPTGASGGLSLGSLQHGTRLVIAYVDAHGVCSERAVSVIGQPNAVSLRAFCEMRRAQRVFKLDRIEWVRDVATGETYHNTAGLFAIAPAA